MTGAEVWRYRQAQEFEGAEEYQVSTDINRSLITYNQRSVRFGGSWEAMHCRVATGHGWL